MARKKERKEQGFCAYMPYLSYCGCSNKPVKGRDKCEEHLSRYGKAGNTEAEMKRLSAKLLGDEGQKGVQRLIHSQPDLVAHMDKLDDLLQKRPEQVLFCDTEWFGTSEEFEEDPTARYVSQISIRNGRLDEVVPEATINYQPRTKSELWDLTGCAEASAYMSRANFRKFYGAADDELATGRIGACSLDFREIAALIEDYYTKQRLVREDCMFIEWSWAGCIDWKNVRKGLRAVGKQDVLPHMPLNAVHRLNIMTCWRKLRSCLETSCTEKEQSIPRMGLNLGNMYSIFYPEDLETLEQEHTANADVKMLFAITKTLFNIYRNRLEPDRIERYFERLDIESFDSGSDPNKKERDSVKAGGIATVNQSKPSCIDDYLRSTKADLESTKGEATILGPRIKTKTKALDNGPKRGPMDQFLTKAGHANNSEIDPAADAALSNGKRAAVLDEDSQRPDKRRKLS
ncbi:hypothetical protein E8E13_004571 [Curvularia kusanoi]|uniref:Uncharacterized protein n=1 Tax=Curvularia kusanoi TaxID=90978 RepID=A0A9P4T707_CURKU|nr:hypothetical protein E8E13_004571 [Curvularia kusanoi]